jgi:uncharacterized protein DUF4349
MSRAFVIAALAALVTACTLQESKSPARRLAQDKISVRGYSEERPDVAMRQVDASGVAAAPARAADPFGRITTATALSAMIIRTGQVSVEVDSLPSAIARVRALAERVGGYIANTEIQTGQERFHSATIEIKVPSERFDEALQGLKPIGKVESINVAAEDVGEEFVDVSARVQNDKRFEARLLDLLTTRTGKLADVIELEQELGRVREEIERYEGRLRYLKAHAATSSLAITVHEPAPIVGEQGSISVIAAAFAQGWRNFVAFLAIVIETLGVVGPLVVVALVGWFAVRRVRAPRRATA